MLLFAFLGVFVVSSWCDMTLRYAHRANPALKERPLNASEMEASSSPVKQPRGVE